MTAHTFKRWSNISSLPIKLLILKRLIKIWIMTLVIYRDILCFEFFLNIIVKRCLFTVYCIIACTQFAIVSHELPTRPVFFVKWVWEWIKHQGNSISQDKALFSDAQTRTPTPQYTILQNCQILHYASSVWFASVCSWVFFFPFHVFGCPIQRNSNRPNFFN